MESNYKVLIRRRLRNSSVKGFTSLSALAGFYGKVSTGSLATDCLHIRDDWKQVGAYISYAHKKSTKMK